jgi:hypothetical protein
MVANPGGEAWRRCCFGVQVWRVVAVYVAPRREDSTISSDQEERQRGGVGF